jgi:hypothetical protein
LDFRPLTSDVGPQVAGFHQSESANEVAESAERRLWRAGVETFSFINYQLSVIGSLFSVSVAGLMAES